MADAILGSVINVAKAIYAIVQGNLQVAAEEKELAELCQLISSSLNGVDGEQASNFKDPLASMLHYLEEAKGICEHLQKRKGLLKAVEMLNPQAMLDKLTTCQVKLLKVHNILGVAFSADAAKKQQEAAREEFDAVAVINHASAKQFWRKQFGSKEYEVKWTRMKGSFQREYKTELTGLLNDENFKILKSKLDPDDEGSVSVYHFADYTDDFGLLKSFLKSVKPESALEKMPESKGPPAEILKRTIFVENALVFDVNDVGPIRLGLEEAAGGGILKTIKFENGMLVEFCMIEHITHVLELDLTKKKKMERKLKIGWAKATVDEVWTKAHDEQEAKKKALEEGKGGGVKAEEAQAFVAIELKMMQEEQDQKVEVKQNEHQAKMYALDKEAKTMMAKAMENKDAKMTPEQVAALELQIKNDIEKKKQLQTESYQLEEKKLADEKEKETRKLKNRYANLTFLTDLFAPSKEKIQNDFMDYFQDNKDEKVIEFYQCSLNGRAFFGDLPRLGFIYITEFAVYFYSSVFGSEVREILRFAEMTTMEKRKYLGFPTALGFIIYVDNDPEDKRDIEFVTFTDRNSTYNKVEEVWDQYVKKASGVLVSAGDRVTFEKNFVIKKEGKLQKKGAVIQNWKERWFVLSENTLTYAKKKGDAIIRAIPLNKVGDCRIDEKNRKIFLFHVITKERTFECKAKNVKEMEDWVDKIKDCLAQLRLSFYYGVIVQQSKSVYTPQWRVLELNFTLKCVRLLNQGRVVVQVPFEQVHRTDRDHENPMIFYFFMKSGTRYNYIAQTGEDREAIVDIMERITRKGNKMVEELLRLRKQIYHKEREKSLASPKASDAKDSKSGGGGNNKSPSNADADAKKLEEAQKMISALERSLHVDEGNVIDDLRQQQAVVIRRGALSVVGTLLNDKRYCILENRDEGARMTVYQNDVSVIPLDIISLKHCTLLQDDEYRFALFSSMTERPWHFQAETPALRTEWMTSLLFSMYPLPVEHSALSIHGTNTTASPSQTSGTMALISPNGGGGSGGGGRSRGYTGVGQPPPYSASDRAGTIIADQKEGYPAAGFGVLPTPTNKRSSMAGGAAPGNLMAGAGALQEKENECNQLKTKLAEAMKKLETAIKDRETAQSDARDADRKMLLVQDTYDCEALMKVLSKLNKKPVPVTTGPPTAASPNGAASPGGAGSPGSPGSPGGAGSPGSPDSKKSN